MSRPLVSVLLVVRNGASVIKRCLETIEAQRWRPLELIIIDGDSDDDTVNWIKDNISNYDIPIRIVSNPNKTLASGWNLGIQSAKGDYLIRPDGHSELDPLAIENGVKKLEINPAWSAVGAVLNTKSKGLVAGWIATVLSNPVGVGGSRFRIGVKKDKETDTAVYALYRREVFEKTGRFNEGMKRNQDIEFHKRAQDLGYRFFTSPDVQATYYSRSSANQFLKQAFSNGYWVTRDSGGHLRHLAPLVFVVGMSGISLFNLPLAGLVLSAYLTICLMSYLLISRVWNPLVWSALLILTLGLHISYGLGSLWGCIRRIVG
ncbi:glycosyltransferase [bacterium]|jgi:glycosyltransferase involved in cell wall biosynthesis|nr:glycosyltransferase [bacterium]